MIWRHRGGGGDGGRGLPVTSPSLVMGLMSGTSGDGVTAALTEIEEPDARLSHRGWPSMRLVHHVTLPFDDTLKQRLFPLFHPETARLDELCRMNVLLADVFADAVTECLQQAGVPRDAVLAVGSHGQTVCHLPPQEEARRQDGVASTLQIGDISVLAERTGLPVVGNFRLRDMAAGGQGAPLVPLADWALFHHPHRGRVIQNIGGIANVTYLPPGGSPDDVHAYDTGPGNMIIDEAMRRLTDGKEAFDRGGRRAARGRVDESLIDTWMAHPYYHAPAPKSTGRETFGVHAAENMIEEARQRGTTGDDLIATVTALTVRTILLHYEKELAAGRPIDDCIIGGGGVFNTTIVKGIEAGLHRLRRRYGTEGANISPTSPSTADGLFVGGHEAFYIPSHAKEAMAFAYLAYATWTARSGNVPGATGANKKLILGTISF